MQKIYSDNNITTGLHLPDKEKIILGYSNGSFKILQYKDQLTNIISENTYNIGIVDFINSITRYIDSPLILITSQESGCVLVFNIDTLIIIYNNKGEFSKYKRVFNSTWLKEDLFYISSTYGKLISYKLGKEVSIENIDGHSSNAVFGLCNWNNLELASGDYFGNIVLWEINENNEKKELTRIKGLQETIQSLKIINSGNTIVSLGKQGSIQIFKKGDQITEWYLYLRYLSGAGVGRFIYVSESETVIYAITEYCIISLDLDTTGIFTYNLPDCVYIEEFKDELLIIDRNGIKLLEKQPSTSKLFEVVNYVKVGVIGTTLTGKSTICYALVNDGNVDPTIKSTKMKNVWDWEYEGIKITLHDFGGQKNIIPAHIPFIIDSDIILLVYSQRDVGTFEIACELRDILITEHNYKKDFIFIQSMGDEFDSVKESVDEYNKLNPEREIIPLYTKFQKIGNVEKVIGIENIKAEIISKIKDMQPKKQIISNENNELIALITKYQDQGIELIDVVKIYESIKLENPAIRYFDVLYALRSLSIQGRIEIQKIGHGYILYLNMKRIIDIKNKILLTLYSKKGFIKTDDLVQKFKEEDQNYYDIALKLLISNDTCIEHLDNILILDFLRDHLDPIDFEDARKYGLIFEDDCESIEELIRNDEIPRPKRWIPSFLNLNIQIFRLSKNEGIFHYYKNNSYCFFSIKKLDPMVEENAQIKVLISGLSNDVKSSLKQNIKIIFDNLLPFSSEKQEIDSESIIRSEGDT